MRFGLTAALLLATLGAAVADPAPELRVRASDSGGLRSSPDYDVRIDPDGAATVTQRQRRDSESAVSLDFKLTADEMDDLRRRVVESKFFDDWGPDGPPPADADSWDVTITLGAQEKHRPSVSVDPRFEPVARFLRRFGAQADAVASIRRGKAVSVALALRDANSRARLFRPDALVVDVGPELVRCAIEARRPYDAGEAAGLLVELTSAAEWTKRAGEILAKLDGDRRDAVLAEWALAVGKPERSAQRTAFVPIAVAEVRGSWKRWADLPYARQDTLRALLALALRERVPEALPLVEEMIRTLSTLDRPFLTIGLVELGVDAVPLASRLLDDAEPTARLAGAALAELLARATKLPGHGDEGLPETGRTALAVRLGAEIVPALERRAHLNGEPLPVREACLRALAVWEGRDLAAERRARRDETNRQRDDAAAKAKAEAGAKRAKEQGLPTPKGDLSIDGRVLAQGDVAVVGFNVLAQRLDGPPQNPWRTFGSATTGADGSFRIDGLVEGEFRLIAVPGRGGGRRDVDGNASLMENVRAGLRDVVARFPGAMLRGRLVDEAGLPVKRRYMSARMRDSPMTLEVPLTNLAFSDTDDDGRFWMFQLVAGVYDVEVPGSIYLRGAAGIVAGPQERTITILVGASIEGRVVDELGDPLGGVSVRAGVVGTFGPTLDAQTNEAGRFRLAGLDPSLRYGIGAVFYGTPGVPGRTGAVQDVATGTTDVVIVIDTAPRVAVRVDFGRRCPQHGPRVRLVPVGDDVRTQREFRSDHVVWRVAPEGAWRVLSLVRDLDDVGNAGDTWMELGTVKTGEPERTLVVPR